MSDGSQSLSLAAGEAKPKTRFQWLALALCAATMFVEGYDAQFMGAVVPAISAEWSVDPAAMTPALVAGLVGLTLGAFFIAPLADNFGRRRVIMGSVAVFGILTLASVWAETVSALVVFRFLTGLGLGGAMANTTALTAESAPSEKRASAVAIMFCTFSLGAGFGGFVAAGLIGDYGWQSVFLVCGGMAVLLFPFLVLGLPESLPAKADAKLTIPAGQLFERGRARITVLFWVIFFANLMELYILTSWLPTTLHAQGIELRWAQIATALVQFGGIAGAFALAPLVDRFGPKWVLAAAFASSAASVVTLGLAGTSVPLTLAMALILGIGTVGAQNCNNGVAAKFYPTAIRATGVGWALAVGRIGSILGPVVGGVLLATGVEIRTIFLVAAVPPLAAAGAYLAMGRPRALAGESA